MALEQIKPEKPNFKLLGILVIIALPIILIIALVFLHASGSHLIPKHESKHPTSQLVLPRPAGVSNAIALG